MAKSTKPKEHLEQDKSGMRLKSSTRKRAKWTVCSEKSVFFGNVKANTLSDSTGVTSTRNGCGS